MIQPHPKQIELALPLPTDYAYAKISSSAMLVDLSISVWTARKLDKKVSQEVDTAKSTKTRAGNYHKNLLAGSSKLEEIGKIASAVRNDLHYRKSIPWSDSGTRLLPSTLFMDYKTELGQYEKMFYDAVDSFLIDYDDLVTKSAFQLGDLFSREDYPDVSKVREKFSFNYLFSPVPESGDFRVDIGEQGMTELRGNYESAYKSRVESSMKDVWDRVYKALNHMSAKLDFTEGKQKLFDSMVDDAVDLCGLLKSLNITGDQRLEYLRIDLEKALHGVDCSDLRESEAIRESTKRKVDEMLDKFAF
jgi:hypothetical protein